MAYKQTLARARLGAVFMTALVVAFPASATENSAPSTKAEKSLPLPVLRGNFLRPGSGDVAMLLHSEQAGMADRYSLVMLPNAASKQPPRVLKNFSAKGPNPPELSLVKPGSYTPVCHDGGRCAPVKIANEAISLCFGEASCEIVYFNGSEFRELVVTD